MWNKTFGGTKGDYAYSVQQTLDGGYIIGGYTESYGTGSGDVWLVKTDSHGNEMWNQTFGGADQNRRSCVQQTTDGGYIIAGYTESYGAGQGDAWLVKTGSNGNEMWNKTFGGTKVDGGRSVQQTTDGGYTIAGYFAGDVGHWDFWLVKTDSNGNKRWDRIFGGAGYDVAQSVQQTTDGGYIIAGCIDGYPEPRGAVVKIDSSGNEMWNGTFGSECTKSVQQTKDGGYIIAGYRSSRIIASYYDVWLIKLGADTTRGDLNSDGILTSADAAIALRLTTGSRLCDPATFAAADVSGDGRVTSLDALMILQAAADNIDL